MGIRFTEGPGMGIAVEVTREVGLFRLRVDQPDMQVDATFASLPLAMKLLDLLLSVEAAAFAPPPEPPVAPDNHPALRDESENVGGLLAGTAS